MPEDCPPLPPVSRELLADLIGRILAEHWLRQISRKRVSQLDNPEQTHQNPKVDQAPRLVE
jgi:hypothetical protein